MTAYTVLDSLLWGFIASIPLLIGCIVALFVNLPKSIIASIMAFGSGVLVAALAFSLIEESFSLSQSIPPVIIGFAAGGLSYTLANYYLNKKSLGNIRKRKRSHGEDAAGSKNASGLALLIGSVMDNIPENMALGISLITGSTVNIVLIVAIFISNFPEGLASTAGMKTNGKSSKQVIILWSIAVFISTMSSVIGFKILSNTSPFLISISISFAAGAILVMLAESMIPEAYEEGGIKIGIATMIGFAIAFALGKL
ncbi:MAG TPA: ZIP family metal transporter [Nitrososphaeraceae archaeon]|nr:ZIP family metal transporter [Nitrososphaeraceae archaeon]